MAEVKSEFKDMIEGMAARSEMFSGLVASLEETEPVVSVRLNRSKIGDGESPEEVAAAKWGGGVERVAWCPEGFYLEERPKFTFDPALHQGRYYVQDASSMIISEVVRRLCTDGRLGDRPLRYLDACAAPGGKTTAAIAALPSGSLVVANEFDFRRAEILNENLIKWGSPLTVVSRGDTGRFRRLGQFFDVISTDVPCSGEGMMRKDRQAVEQWSVALVEECAERQKEILDNLWGALKPGGFLVYSTCTFNTRENEEIVRWLVDSYGAEPVDMRFPDEWGVMPGVLSDVCCSRFLPNRLKGEGLFLAVVKKPGVLVPSVSEPKVKERRKGGKQPVKDAVDLKRVSGWISAGDVELSVKGDEVRAVPAAWSADVARLERELDVVRACLPVASVKGRDLIPSHALAVSTALNPSAFPAVEVDQPTALSYLRREAVVLPEGTPKGYVLLSFGGAPLGFVKNLGNRANNLYPQPWRILSRL